MSICRLMSVLLVTSLALSLWPGIAAGTPRQELTNLALGRPYTVSVSDFDAGLANIEQSFPDTDQAELTDGLFGDISSYSHPAWVGYLRQGNRTITIDLGRPSGVYTIRAHFLQDKAAGIRFPRKVNFAISMNGQHWANIGTVTTAIPLSRDGKLEQWFSINAMVKARYVRVTFLPDVWSFIDEIEVIGTATPDHVNVLKPDKKGSDQLKPRGYARPGTAATAGASHQVLIYTGTYKNQPLLTWDKARFIPYVGYVASDGSITDFMFDSFLFLPVSPNAAGRRYDSGAPQSNMEDWVTYLNQIFADGYQLEALNEAVGEVKAILGKSDYQLPVYIAVPYPSPSQTNFGDLDGDGVSESFSEASYPDDPIRAYHNRVAAIEWYMDEVIRRWNEAGLDQLRLAGFYWHSETVLYANSEFEEAVIRAFNRLAHERGMLTEWIPYFNAEGFRDWAEYGFDVAVHQPNYVFNTSVPKSRLDSAADLAYKYGLGVEMEMNWQVLHLSEYQNRYYDYLDQGVAKGYMTGAFLSWYQEVKLLYDAAYSTNPMARDVYDKTYQFIKGTYQPRS